MEGSSSTINIEGNINYGSFFKYSSIVPYRYKFGLL
jgi:hypothetical protein